VTSHKFRAFTTLLLTITASLLFVASSAAQTTTPSSLTVLRFNDGGDDRPGRMTTDAAGNFYVTLGSDIAPSGFFEILKYNSQNKLTVIRHLNQPGEFAGKALAVKTDKLGNIYAVGSSSIGGLVVSFTPSGSQRWADHFNGIPVALAVDATGNVYAAGTLSTGNFQSEFAVTKYSSSGKVLWEAIHAGTIKDDVRLTDMQLDSAGNPVLLGTTNIALATLTSTMTTWKLDTQGATLWVRDFVANPHASNNPSGLALDAADSVYATGETGPVVGFAFTVKYDLKGNRQFVLSGDESGGVSVAIDPSGDVLLVGGLTVSNLPPVAVSVVSKYHPNGVKVWTTQVVGAGKVLSDASGNIFVAGSLPQPTINPTGDNYFVSKLSPNGKFLFNKIFPQGQDVSDAAFDTSGNLIVTGHLVDSVGDQKIVTLKLAKGFTPASAHSKNSGRIIAV